MPMLKTVPTERKRNALEDVTVTLLNNWMLFCVGVGLGVVDVATLLLEVLISSLFSIFFSLSLSLFLSSTHVRICSDISSSSSLFNVVSLFIFRLTTRSRREVTSLFFVVFVVFFSQKRRERERERAKVLFKNETLNTYFYPNFFSK